ncbi:hypothetical protein M2171_007417 [Bradyrhizobium japonicum USDA 38]|uniref:hypothetical protein n=1 Tax=Bradyrhizobium japonicum TaxID=375 RepID=UPI000481A070|nr:hypothetical protein [Bradyrhizobium japonicum]MCS3898284.1 hypothetical protein [Bradyrhizobium japonicum USDA 38]MCS3941337.1 hypothetical protein [Bradyrhizobium japonicum]MCW2216607.1 hypothetical protein [Bradyrhizobium japonicum]MCW2341223.1 hypothetical protein [Bradyrhizobium japonicum]
MKANFGVRTGARARSFDHEDKYLQPLVGAAGTANAASQIIAIEMTDIESVEKHRRAGTASALRFFASNSMASSI